MVVYAMLVVSAGATLLAGDRLWGAVRLGDLPIWAPLLAPIAFTLFVVLFAIDRWIQVQRNHYNFMRAFFQVGLAVIFLSFLWPHQAEELRAARQTVRASDPVLRLLRHREPDVRAAACELLGLRRQAQAYAQVQDLATNDTSPHVREQCARAAAALEPSRPFE